MKILKILSLSLAALFLLSSCSQTEKKDSIDVTEAVDNIDVTEASTDNDDVTTTTNSTNPRDENNNYVASLSKVTTELSEYNGEELTLTVRLNNKGQSFDQAFFLYVNGERNDYSTDEYPDEQPYHVYSLPEGESIEVTLHFTPYNCKKGEKAIVYVVSMLTPDYMLEDYSYVSFGNHHNIVGLWPYELSINEDAPESEYNKISTDCIKTEMTEEYEQEYIEDRDGETYNSLDNNNYLRLHQQEGVLGSYYIAEDDELTLNISACGMGGNFLVGIYINHELQKAFGDNYYALCEIDREYLTTITATIDISELSGLNHIYMIAVPCDTAEFERDAPEYPTKTASSLLIIGNKEEIEADMEEIWADAEKELEEADNG